MPTLSETTSSFEMSEKTRIGAGDYLGKKILQWFLENKSKTRNTTLSEIVKLILIPGVEEKQIENKLYKLSRKGVIISDKRWNRARKNFFINFSHPETPQEIIDQATPEQLDKAQKALGIVAERFLRPKVALKEPSLRNVEKPVEEESPKGEVLLSTHIHEPTIQPTEINIPSESLKNGLSLTLTININLK